MASDYLATLAEVKALLKYTDNDSDARLSLLIGAASASILRFLKSDGDEYRDTGGAIVPGNVPDDIKAAAVMLVGHMDRNPDINDDKIFEAERLPAPVEAILHSRREPTLA